ncbi:MAG: hypothetical protein C0399_11980 [Syntrophus sp. (in: bacteria)]|nr:hypothetical protein [Syntrophus sp. (in: bacteria)]
MGIELRDMRNYLINKNLCCYCWLRQRIGKNRAFRLVRTTEKIIVIFGREKMRLEEFRQTLC